MNFDVTKFGERIKELRVEKGITTIQMGKELGISDATVSRWENGLLIPKADSIFALAKFFGVSAGYLIGLEN